LQVSTLRSPGPDFRKIGPFLRRRNSFLRRVKPLAAISPFLSLEQAQIRQIAEAPGETLRFTEHWRRPTPFV
jgi:hypothetical protein